MVGGVLVIARWLDIHGSRCGGAKDPEMLEFMIGMMEDNFVAQEFLQLLDGSGGEAVLVMGWRLRCFHWAVRKAST